MLSLFSGWGNKNSVKVSSIGATHPRKVPRTQVTYSSDCLMQRLSGISSKCAEMPKFFIIVYRGH